VQTPQWPTHRAGHAAAGLGNEQALDQLDPHYNLPQSPEDRQAPGYWNDVPLTDWRRGANEDATGKVGYDHHPGKHGHGKRGGRDGHTEGVPASRLPHEESPLNHLDDSGRFNHRSPRRGNRDFSHEGKDGRDLYNMKSDGGSGATHRGKYK
jgi:hypothetical protein